MCVCETHSVCVRSISSKLYGHRAEDPELTGHLVHPTEGPFLICVCELHHQTGGSSLHAHTQTLWVSHIHTKHNNVEEICDFRAEVSLTLSEHIDSFNWTLRLSFMTKCDGKWTDLWESHRGHTHYREVSGCPARMPTSQSTALRRTEISPLYSTNHTNSWTHVSSLQQTSNDTSHTWCHTAMALRSNTWSQMSYWNDLETWQRCPTFVCARNKKTPKKIKNLDRCLKMKQQKTFQSFQKSSHSPKQTQ